MLYWVTIQVAQNRSQNSNNIKAYLRDDKQLETWHMVWEQPREYTSRSLLLSWCWSPFSVYLVQNCLILGYKGLGESHQKQNIDEEPRLQDSKNCHYDCKESHCINTMRASASASSSLFLFPAKSRNSNAFPHLSLKCAKPSVEKDSSQSTMRILNRHRRFLAHNQNEIHLNQLHNHISYTSSSKKIQSSEAKCDNCDGIKDCGSQIRSAINLDTHISTWFTTDPPKVTSQ